MPLGGFTTAISTDKESFIVLLDHEERVFAFDAVTAAKLGRELLKFAASAPPVETASPPEKET